MIKFKHDWDEVEGERVNANTETTMRSQDQNWKIEIEIFFSHIRHNTKQTTSAKQWNGFSTPQWSKSTAKLKRIATVIAHNAQYIVAQPTCT